MPTRYDIAKRLYGARSGAGSSSTSSSVASSGGISGNGSSSLTMRYGTAVADSADGWVDVKLDTTNIVSGESTTVHCACDSPISSGQRVCVLFSVSGNLKAIPIGDNIENGSVKSVVIQYAGSDSGTVAPTSGWSERWPSSSDYVWSRTITTYGNGSTTISDPVCIDRPPEGYDADTTFYATSSTAASTTAKVATISSSQSGFSLKTGVVVSVRFSSQNTASSPTLNVNSTGAKAIYTNGTRYAYWAAGTSVLFMYDGSYWQCCSAPVYANTVTVGNPASRNMYIDSSHLAVRNGTTEYATFDVDEVHIGLNDITSGFFLADDSVSMKATEVQVPANSYQFEILSSSSGSSQLSGMAFGISGQDGILSFARSGSTYGTWETTLTGLLMTRLYTYSGPLQVDAGTLDLTNCDSVVKPGITVGRASTSSLSSSDTIQSISTIYGNSGNSSSTSFFSIYRSGNYVYVNVPRARGSYDKTSAYVEVSAQATAGAVNNSNFAGAVYVSRTYGTGSPSVSKIDSTITTSHSSGSDFLPLVVAPAIVSLPKPSSSSSYAYSTYRFYFGCRSSNATGTCNAWRMTVKAI